MSQLSNFRVPIYFISLRLVSMISTLQDGQRDVRQVIPLHMENNEEAVRAPVLMRTRTAEVIRVPLGALFRVYTMVDVHVHGSN